MIENIKTVNDLRGILAEEIKKVRDGTTTAANVNAITNATGKILSTIKMEIEYNKLLGKTPFIPFIEADNKKSDREQKGKLPPSKGAMPKGEQKDNNE